MTASPALAQISSLSPPGAPDAPMAPTIWPAASIGMPPIMTTPGRFLIAWLADPGVFTRMATVRADSCQHSAVRALPSAAARVCQPRAWHSACASRDALSAISGVMIFHVQVAAGPSAWSEVPHTAASKDKATIIN